MKVSCRLISSVAVIPLGVPTTLHTCYIIQVIYGPSPGDGFWVCNVHKSRRHDVQVFEQIVIDFSIILLIARRALNALALMIALCTLETSDRQDHATTGYHHASITDSERHYASHAMLSFYIHLAKSTSPFPSPPSPTSQFPLASP